MRFKLYFKYQVASFSSTQSTFIGKPISRGEGTSLHSHEEHLNVKSRTLLTSCLLVNRPYKELLSDLVLLEKFSLAVFLIHKPLISPTGGTGILCCVIFPCYFDLLHSLFQIQFLFLST